MTAIELEINWRIRDDRYRHNAKRGQYLTPESAAAVVYNRVQEANLLGNAELLRMAWTWTAPERKP